MKTKNKAVITKDQPSITEWFAAIGEIKEANDFRREDNEKSVRLEILFQTIGLPYERPDKMEARELSDFTPHFRTILHKQGHELCALRLIPKKESLPKLRIRGLSVMESYYSWFLKQKINPEDYFVHLCPHSNELLWSSIFVVNRNAIFGEIIRGLHSQLTHGDTKSSLYQFHSNFRSWQWSENDSTMQKVVKDLVQLLLVSSKEKQRKLQQKLNSQFSHNYLTGYFEAVVWPQNKIFFVDYNRILPRFLTTPPPLFFNKKERKIILSGRSAHAGVVKGKVRIVLPSQIKNAHFRTGEILVCDNTDIRYLPLMKKAGAIITNRGNILSHPAIISRELKKPCIVGTKNATSILKNGETVIVDANKGVVKKEGKS